MDNVRAQGRGGSTLASNPRPPNRRISSGVLEGDKRKQRRSFTDATPKQRVRRGGGPRYNSSFPSTPGRVDSGDGLALATGQQRSGFVQWYNEEKHFGTILTEGVNTSRWDRHYSIFFHSREVAAPNPHDYVKKMVKSGLTVVEFIVRFDNSKKKHCASQVKFLSKAPAEDDTNTSAPDVKPELVKNECTPRKEPNTQLPTAETSKSSSTPPKPAGEKIEFADEPRRGESGWVKAQCWVRVPALAEHVVLKQTSPQ